MFKSKVVSVLALLLITGIAQAHPGGEGPRGRHGMMGDFGGSIERMVEHLSRAAEKLDLSDEQLDQIFAVADASRGELRDLMMQMHDNKKALRETARLEQYDAAAIAELAATQGDLTARMIVLRTRMRAEIMAIFSPEQRSKMEELKEHRRGHRGRSVMVVLLRLNALKANWCQACVNPCKARKLWW